MNHSIAPQVISVLLAPTLLDLHTVDIQHGINLQNNIPDPAQVSVTRITLYADYTLPQLINAIEPLKRTPGDVYFNTYGSIHPEVAAITQRLIIDARKEYQLALAHIRKNDSLFLSNH